MRPPQYTLPIDPRRIRRLVLRLVIVVVLLVTALQSLSFYVDGLWFDSLGYASVFWYRLRVQALVFLISGAASGLVLWLLIRLVMPSTGFTRRFDIGGEKLILPSAESLKGLILPVAVVLAVFFGLSFSGDWSSFALFLHRPPPDANVDPILGRSLSFYLFTLPVMQSVASGLLAISVLGLIAAMVLSVTERGADFKGVSLAAGILLLAIAFQSYAGRFDRLLEDHSLFSGVQYVDDHVILPGLWLVIAALVTGAAIAIVNMRLGRVMFLGVAIGLPVAMYIVVEGIAPAYVSMFVVRPNELVRESPYIHHNIEFTRKAFGLDRVEQFPFEPRLTDTTFDRVKHAPTLDNIRLWDWRALQATLRQIQEIRPYYDFFDVDVDRYTVNGKPQQMMLAARELSLNKLPAGSRNWVNERLVYTHGYGVTMNPVSRFTKEGLPELILSNMPVESTQPDIRITRPEIYYGELTDWPVFVKTRQKEFNFPQGDANNYTTYEGAGGIQMGSFLRRLALAWTIGDLTKVPFSDDVTADSALLMRRNIRERVTEIAPFLQFDDDPYLVIGNDGRLYWMMDAYTVSDRYPYSRHLTVAGREVNYIRNSVKAVVDAYTGAVDFYIFDPTDPLIQAYAKMFPALFKPADQMPEFLRKHVRYPEMLTQVQAVMFANYHVENEQVFYGREDVWTVAQQGRGQTGGQASDSIEPTYILMQLPGSDQVEFVAMLPFTPANRTNLIGWLAARCDGDAYGSLRAYQFPKTRFVNGPQQIQARIDQDPQLSGQFTLWNQQGSTVIRGNLLVIPLDDTLLYAEPVYLQAERSPMPELRMVVLVTQDRLAYATRFPEALVALLGSPAAPPAPTQAASSTGAAPPPSNTSQAPSLPQLGERANRAFSDYQRLTAEGKLGEAGQKLEELKRTLEEMGRAR